MDLYQWFLSAAVHHTVRTAVSLGGSANAGISDKSLYQREIKVASGLKITPPAA